MRPALRLGRGCDEPRGHRSVQRHDLILGRFLPEELVQLFHFFRVLGRDVVELRPVVLDVVQFIREAGRVLAHRPGNIPRWTHDLGAGDPAVVIDGVVAHHLEVLRVVARRRVGIGLVEGVGEADALDGLLRDSVHHLRRLYAGHFQDGRARCR